MRPELLRLLFDRQDVHVIIAKNERPPPLAESCEVGATGSTRIGFQKEK